MLNNFFYIVNVCGKKDIPESWHLGFQEAAAPVMEEIVFFHDQIMFLLVIIVIVVLWLLVEALNGKYYDRDTDMYLETSEWEEHQ